MRQFPVGAPVEMGAWYLYDMNRRQLIRLIAATATLLPWRAGATDPLRIVTASFPPLSIDPDSGRPGALTEVVREICRRLQHRASIEFLPWQRAIHTASNGAKVAIYPLTRLPVREKNFSWLAPLFEEHYVFLARRNGGFDVTRPEQMHDRRITLVRGGTQGAILQEHGFTKLVEARSVQEVHRYLVAGMADAAFGERNIVRASLKQWSAEQDFVVSEPLRSTTAWLAGSLDFNDTEIAQYKQAISTMRADGSYKKILAKYGLV